MTLIHNAKSFIHPNMHVLGQTIWSFEFINVLRIYIGFGLIPNSTYFGAFFEKFMFKKKFEHHGLRELNHTAFAVYKKIMTLGLTASGPLFFRTPHGLCDLILS